VRSYDGILLDTFIKRYN